MKVWTYGVKKEDDGTFSHMRKPILKEYPDESIKQFPNDRPIVRMDIVPAKTILFLFKDEATAIGFQEGYIFGCYDPELVWNDVLTKTDELGLEHE